MPRPRLSDEEREARRRERNRRGFAEAKFRQFDPNDGIGYGSAEQWRSAAHAKVGGAGFTMSSTSISREIRADLDEFGFPQMPSLEQLRSTYRRMAVAKHPNGGGTHEGFIAFKAAYDRLLAHIQSEAPRPRRRKSA